MEREGGGRYKAKYKPDEDRVCPRCQTLLPAGSFHAKTRNSDGSIRTRQTLCKVCAKERNRELNGFRPQSKMSQAEIKERRRAGYDRVSADPVRAEQRRRRKREQARRRRERAKVDPVVAESLREASERYRRKVMLDPETHAWRLVDQRIRYRDGHPNGARHRTAVEAFAATREQVDAGPFLAYLAMAFPDATSEQLETMLGIPSQRFRELNDGKERISISLIDRALTTGLGRPDLVAVLYPMEGAT